VFLAAVTYAKNSFLNIIMTVLPCISSHLFLTSEDYPVSPLIQYVQTEVCKLWHSTQNAKPND